MEAVRKRRNTYLREGAFGRAQAVVGFGGDAKGRSMFRRTCLAVLLLAAVARPGLAADKPILEAGTEEPMKGAVRPSPGLVRVVLGALIDKFEIEELRDCLKQEHLKRTDYAALLRAVRIDAGGGRTLWFVRPALEPYCHVLYGAHLFRYFWIEELPPGTPKRYRLLFHNGGDMFAVYRKQSHGLNDIKATGCIVDECR
ncbi:MAG TPA: hypothetical protein VFV07_03070, partial [Rhizomicrobium sp.]|nr:hypothetical protein [Rhizomicrobium sp.]